jgi:hypothetical protein
MEQDVFSKIAQNFPIFSYETHDIQRRFARFDFTWRGVEDLWIWFNLLRNNVLDYLRKEYLGKDDAWLERNVNLWVVNIREDIERLEGRLDCELKVLPVVQQAVANAQCA